MTDLLGMIILRMANGQKEEGGEGEEGVGSTGVV